MIELALRRRIALVRDPNRRQLPLPERVVEVIDDRQTGETILDETLRMMKGQEQERMSVNSWIDLLSGESLLALAPALGRSDALAQYAPGRNSTRRRLLTHFPPRSALQARPGT